jgi:X-Pro dipeptidyl-peptidase (S15 family)
MRIPSFAGALLLLAGVIAQADDQGVRLVKTSILMPDGVQLAATLYMPADLKPGRRVPALLEYLPYRKDDDDAVGDYGHHVYFARHGSHGSPGATARSACSAFPGEDSTRSRWPCGGRRH